MSYYMELLRTDVWLISSKQCVLCLTLALLNGQTLGILKSFAGGYVYLPEMLADNM